MPALTEKRVIQELKDWGCDTKGAMARMLDDESFYLDCLKMFYEDPCFAALGKQLEQNDLPAAFDSAHTLKGVSANLGLTPLLDAVCRIVEPLRSGKSEGTREQYRRIMDLRAEFGRRVHLL